MALCIVPTTRCGIIVLSMAGTAPSVAQLSIPTTEEAAEAPRHSGLVRITHWVNTVSFAALLVSGVAILISHPRLYWGEVGNVNTPSLIDLPLPFIIAGQNGWGRYLHFLAAWVCVVNGLAYVLSGLLTRHFRTNLLPAGADLTRRSLSRALADHLRPARLSEDVYNVVQRLAYSGVVFVLLPVAIWTGLAMSPAITSVLPWLATGLGGHQSARTVHFVAALLLVVFLLVHVGMIVRTGFWRRMTAMVTGRGARTRSRSE